MAAALWACASAAQPPGVAWEADFDPVHTLTANLGALRAQPSFDQDATLAPGPGGDFYFFSRDTSGRPVLSLLSQADDSIIRQHTAGGQGLGIWFALSAGRPLIDGGALLLRQGLARASRPTAACCGHATSIRSTPHRRASCNSAMAI